MVSSACSKWVHLPWSWIIIIYLLDGTEILSLRAPSCLSWVLWLGTGTLQPSFAWLPHQLLELWGIVWVLPPELVVVFTPIPSAWVSSKRSIHVTIVSDHAVLVMSMSIIILHALLHSLVTLLSLPVCPINLRTFMRCVILLLLLSQLH